ncbi:MAG TPA: hypothetical protein VII59_16550 [Streptosporangiaceae bacterium]|jgi:hypothetical protein
MMGESDEGVAAADAFVFLGAMVIALTRWSSLPFPMAWPPRSRQARCCTGLGVDAVDLHPVNRN